LKRELAKFGPLTNKYIIMHDTTIDEIDTQIEDQGYITTLQLFGSGQTATATADLSVGYIKEIFLNTFMKN
jgi:hypothetical protein